MPNPLRPAQAVALEDRLSRPRPDEDPVPVLLTHRQAMRLVYVLGAAVHGLNGKMEGHRDELVDQLGALSLYLTGLCRGGDRLAQDPTDVWARLEARPHLLPRDNQLEDDWWPADDADLVDEAAKLIHQQRAEENRRGTAADDNPDVCRRRAAELVAKLRPS